MMNEVNNDLLSLEYDCHFEEMYGLTWFPWIGKEYYNSEHRLLIVGESHYLIDDKEDPEKVEKNKEEAEQQDFTRNVIQTFCIDNKKLQPTFDNLTRCLFDKQKMKKITLEMREDMWRHLAFYNFVQRPMENNLQRPTAKDIQTGWNVFAELTKVLRPTECVFIGFATADSYNPYKCRRSKEKVGRYAARLFSVPLDDQNTCRCIAIKHTSQYFSWEKWRKILEKENFLF